VQTGKVLSRIARGAPALLWNRDTSPFLMRRGGMLPYDKRRGSGRGRPEPSTL